MFTSDITDGFCLATFGRQIIEFRCFQSRDIRMILPQQNIIHQFTGHRDFSFRSFAQRDPNGISQSVTQQRTDAKGGLDTSVFSISGFCHPEVERESHPLFFHDVHQQTNSLHHYHCIGGFDGNHYICEVLHYTDTKEFHTGFHHSFGSIAITGHDTIGQRAMIYSDPDSRVILFTDIQERDKPVMDFLYFLRILLVCIFQFLKSTSSIYIISRIDSHLFRILSSHVCHFRIEMHISNQRNHISLATQSDINVHQIFGFFDALGCEAYILSTCINNTFRLFHTSLCILCRRVCHRLDTNRIGAAQRHSPNIYFCGFSSKIIE